MRLLQEIGFEMEAKRNVPQELRATLGKMDLAMLKMNYGRPKKGSCYQWQKRGVEMTTESIYGEECVKCTLSDDELVERSEFMGSAPARAI